MPAIWNILKPGGRLLVFCLRDFSIEVDRMVTHYTPSTISLNKSQVLPWIHEGSGSNENPYATSEGIRVFWRKNEHALLKRWPNARPSTEFYHRKDGEVEKAMKPLSLMRDLIRTFERSGDGVVLDFCMKTAVCGCAAMLEGRSFVGVELDTTEGHFLLAVKHLQATLKISTGAPSAAPLALPCIRVSPIVGQKGDEWKDYMMLAQKPEYMASRLLIYNESVSDMHSHLPGPGNSQIRRSQWTLPSSSGFDEDELNDLVREGTRTVCVLTGWGNRKTFQSLGQLYCKELIDLSLELVEYILRVTNVKEVIFCHDPNSSPPGLISLDTHVDMDPSVRRYISDRLNGLSGRTTDGLTQRSLHSIEMELKELRVRIGREMLDIVGNVSHEWYDAESVKAIDFEGVLACAPTYLKKLLKYVHVRAQVTAGSALWIS